MTNKCSDVRHVVVLVELVEAGDPIDVDERARRREAELHERDQTLPAREYLRFVAVALENRDRLLHRRGGEVLEPGGVHGRPSLPALSRETGRAGASIRSPMSTLQPCASDLSMRSKRPFGPI